MKAISYYVLLFSIVLLTSCGGGDEYNEGYYDNEPKKQFIKNPIDDLIRDMATEPTFSIILHDMDVKEDPDKGTSYQHQYRIISSADTVEGAEPNITEWKPVSEKMFWDNENNMGMELASKTEDGKISKVASPPGYSNYVGNKKYGHWQTNSSGQSFWAWYGQYAFMSSMFRTSMYPVYRYDYATYSNYRSNNRPYYGGTSSNPRYGTNSALNKSTNPNFFQRKASNNAWTASTQRKASSGYSSKSYGSSSSSSYSKNTSRYSSGSSSSSSYSSGSSYRSSGGSYGK